MRLRNWSISATLWSTLLLVTGCGCGPAAEASNLASEGGPKVLRFAVSIARENPETAGGGLEPVRRYLGRRMGMPVEVTGTNGYGAVIEAFRAKKLEACSLGPFAYVIGSQRAGIEAIATRCTAAGESRTYAGTLSVAAASPLESMADIIRRARELTISFVDPASTSGNLVQRVYFQSLGIKPEPDFKKAEYSTQHVTSGLALLAGKVDVAVVSQNTLEALVQTGKIRSAEQLGIAEQ
jgi:phosphonate transport system substrate-binding protein